MFVLTGCVIFPYFVLTSEIIRNPSLKSVAIVVVETKGFSNRILDFSPGLLHMEIGKPMDLENISAQKFVVIEADCPYYHELLLSLILELEYITPLVEEGDNYCLYLDLSALEDLYGAEQDFIVKLRSVIPSIFDAKLGVANNKFNAYIAALLSKDESINRAASSKQLCTEDLSVNVLPVSSKAKLKLHEFSLHTLKDIASLPIDPLISQFGLEGKLISALSNGLDSSRVIPRNIEKTVFEEVVFDDPILTFDYIILQIELLLNKAFLNTSIVDKSIRFLIIKGAVLGGNTLMKRVAFKEPTRDKERILFKIRSILENMRFPGPIESLSLTLSGLIREAGYQSSLFHDLRKREHLKESIKHMSAVFGKPAPLFNIKEVDPCSRIPERRYALVQLFR